MKNIIYVVLLLGIFTTSGYSQAPVANFTASVTEGCGPLRVTFTDASTGNPTGWTWDFGNGNLSKQQNPTTTFAAGIHSVTLVVRNSAGVDEITKTAFITVLPSPVARIGTDLDVACFGRSILFTDQSTPPAGETITSWQWRLGDGATSSNNQVAHNYDEPGNYTAQLMVVSSNGCSSQTASRGIRILPGITSDFIATTDSVCTAPFTLNLKNESVGPGTLTYNWQVESANSTEKDPSITLNNAGTYNIRLSTTSQYGCTHDTTKTITLLAATSSIQPPPAICLEVPATFNSTTTPASLNSYWRLEQSNPIPGSQFTHTFTTPGDYTLKLYNDFGFCKDSATTIVQVQPPGAVNFSASEVNGCQAPFSTGFTSIAPDAVSWAWDFGDNNTSSLQNPAHTYQTAGNFNVTLTITNANGCTSTITRPAFINIVAPTISEAGLRAGGCVGFNYRPIASIQSITPIISYAWNFGDGNTSTQANPSNIYNSPGNYTVTLTITTAGGCSATRTITNAVRVGTLPQADFTVDRSNNCLTTHYQFVNNSVNSQEWLWDFGDGNTSSLENPSHQYSEPGVYTITLTATNNGCPHTITRTNHITVDPPLARFSFNSDCGVNILNFEFTNNSVINNLLPVSYLWEFGNSGPTSTDANPNFTFPDYGTYPVTLTVTNGGCINTITHTVRITREVADFTISSTEVCKHANFTLTPTGSNPGNIRTYSWTINNGTPFLKRGSFDTSIALNGTYPIGLTITDNNGCTHTLNPQKQITVKGPNAQFTTNITSPCRNVPVTFTDATISNSPIIRRVWNFGDNTVLPNGALQENHSYTANGNFNQILIVEDQEGCTDTAKSTTPILISSPTANFSIESETICPKLPVQFTDHSQGTHLTYHWDFGDGNSSDEKDPSHQYADVNATYPVTLTVTDEQGCTGNAATSSKSIIAITPKAAISVSDSVFLCVPAEVSFTHQSSDHLSIHWDFDNGNTTSKEAPLQFFNNRRTYQVRLYAVGYGGCVDIAEQSINLLSPNSSIISFNPIDATACNQLDVDFNITLPHDDLRFRFNFGDNTSSTDQALSFQHRYDFPSTYRPSIVLMDRQNCNVTVNSSRTIEIKGAVPAFSTDIKNFCDRGIVNFADHTLAPGNEDITDYRWTFVSASTSSEIGTSSEVNPQFEFLEPDTYFVRLAVTTNYPCTSYFYDTIRVYRTPAPIISPVTICANEWAEFEASLEVADTSITWNWVFPGLQDTARQQRIHFPEAGTFQYSLTATNLLNCSGTAQNSITIHTLPEIQIPDDIRIPSGGSILLPINYSTDVTSWQWEPAASLSCIDCAQPTASPQFSTTYKLTVTNEHGCETSKEIPVRVVCTNLNFFVPNTFSPNKDGTNDVFFPRGSGINKVASMRIYNRWGALVFEKKNFPPNDPVYGWDGEKNGQPCPADTYIYTVELICENAEIVPYKGNITLIR